MDANVLKTIKLLRRRTEGGLLSGHLCFHVSSFFLVSVYVEYEICIHEVTLEESVATEGQKGEFEGGSLETGNYRVMHISSLRPVKRSKELGHGSIVSFSSFFFTLLIKS